MAETDLAKIVLQKNTNGKITGPKGFQEVHAPEGWECFHANRSGKPPEYQGHIIVCKECKAAFDNGASFVDEDGADIDVVDEITVE